MTLKEFDREHRQASRSQKTNVGQVVTIEQKEGRTTADARNPSTPIVQPTPAVVCPKCGGMWPTADSLQVHMDRDHPATPVKPIPLKAEMLKLGQRVIIHMEDYGESVAVVKLVYPANFRESRQPASVFLEAENHWFSGHFFDREL